MKLSAAATFALAVAFTGGFATHFLYQRWNSSAPRLEAAGVLRAEEQSSSLEPKNHRVTFAPLTTPAPPVELPLMEARNVDKIRAAAGTQARIRGRIFRVGHSARSNTYFLNFGPSREALTGVIFASAVELFEKRKLAPKSYEGRAVEIEGLVKDHPQFGLEIILEDPAQIRIID
jgi:hypothetical protein